MASPCACVPEEKCTKHDLNRSEHIHMTRLGLVMLVAMCADGHPQLKDAFLKDLYEIDGIDKANLSVEATCDAVEKLKQQTAQLRLTT